MDRFTPRTVRATVLPVLAALTLMAHPAAAQPAVRAAGDCGPAWRIVDSPSPGSIGNSLSKVVALSSTDAWAVGAEISAPHDLWTQRTLAIHWDGATWAKVRTPRSFTGGLSGLYAVSRTDVWAVGSKLSGPFESKPLVEHYDGSAWSEIPSPPIELGNLFDAEGTSGSDIWAVGTVRGPVGMLIEHYDGSAWTRVHAPKVDSDYVQLGGVDAITATDAWAAGYFLDRNTGVYRNLVVHFDGRGWQLVETPDVGSQDNQLFDVAAVNAENVWVVGHAMVGNRFRTLAMQHTGGRWVIHHTPSPGSGDTALSGVAAGPRGTMWAVGSFTENGMDRTLTEFYMDAAWNGVHSLNADKEENDLSSVAISPDGDVWAVGASDPHAVGQTLTEHICP